MLHILPFTPLLWRSQTQGKWEMIMTYNNKLLNSQPLFYTYHAWHSHETWKLLMRNIQMKPVWGLFWVKEQRPIKTVPTDNESESPLTHQLMHPLHKGLPSWKYCIIFLVFVCLCHIMTSFMSIVSWTYEMWNICMHTNRFHLNNHYTCYYNIIFNLQAQTTTDPYLRLTDISILYKHRKPKNVAYMRKVTSQK
jgi:hypothetical protein